MTPPATLPHASGRPRRLVAAAPYLVVALGAVAADVVVRLMTSTGSLDWDRAGLQFAPAFVVAGLVAVTVARCWRGPARATLVAVAAVVLALAPFSIARDLPASAEWSALGFGPIEVAELGEREGSAYALAALALVVLPLAALVAGLTRPVPPPRPVAPSVKHAWFGIAGVAAVASALVGVVALVPDGMLVLDMWFGGPVALLTEHGPALVVAVVLLCHRAGRVDGATVPAAALLAAAVVHVGADRWQVDFYLAFPGWTNGVANAFGAGTWIPLGDAPYSDLLSVGGLMTAATLLVVGGTLLVTAALGRQVDTAAPERLHADAA